MFNMVKFCFEIGVGSVLFEFGVQAIIFMHQALDFHNDPRVSVFGFA